jgi:hypothetical protein
MEDGRATLKTEGPKVRVRDTLWLWGHPAGSHHGEEARHYNVPGASRITPVEAAHYMGIPNLLMVTYPGFGPEPPYDQLALSMRSLDQVVWSVVGAAGETNASARDEVLKLARRTPNITGIMMDDFFHDPGAEDEGKRAALSLSDLRAIRDQLVLDDRTLDLWVVLYDYQLGKPVDDYLGLCDVVTFWTWQSQHLPRLEENFQRFEQTAAAQTRLLGCYLWDYGNEGPMPVDLMQKQCEFGLEMLKAGRISGMIMLASCICDLELETVEWTRRWIAEVGEMELRRGHR